MIRLGFKNHIWKRHFLFELLKVFCLFIGSFYFLYVLIDYSTHSKVFQSVSISWYDVCGYYLYQFANRADLLIPIALIISTIKVLSTATVRNEVLALVTGGISLKKILRPFLFAALFFTLLLYANFQFFQPLALNHIQQFETQHFKERSLEEQEKKVQALSLEDNSLLIYKTYDNQREAFFDVFWLKNADEVYRIQELFPHEEIPMGRYVDTLCRTQSGEMIKIASTVEQRFPTLKFEPKMLFNAVHPPRHQPLTELVHHFEWRQNRLGMGKMNDREAEIVTLLFYKITMPLICLLAVLGPTPFCFNFNRRLPLFMIYALSLFGMIAYFTLINASVILGESQIIPPLLALLIPEGIIFLILGWKYVKI